MQVDTEQENTWVRVIPDCGKGKEKLKMCHNRDGWVRVTLDKSQGLASIGDISNRYLNKGQF